MARGPVEPVRMPPYHYQKQHVGGGGSASAEKGPAMTDPHKVANSLTEAMVERDTYLEQIGGCGDGNCIIVKPKGMHTNGGCHCYMDRMKMQRFAYASNRFSAAVRHILEEQTNEH